MLTYLFSRYRFKAFVGTFYWNKSTYTVMFLHSKRESTISKCSVYKPLHFSPFFDHSRHLACTTDILSSYTHTAVSVCRDFFSQIIHCNLCLDIVLQPSGTHLSHDSTQI